MITALILIFFSTFILNGSDPAENEEEGWSLKKKDARFQVYQREKADSEIKEVKTIALITGSIDETLQVVNDLANFTAIFDPHVEKSAVLKTNNSCSDLYILINPPVFSKRETTVELCTSEISENSFKLNWTDFREKGAVKSENIKMNWFSGGCRFSKTGAPDEIQVDCRTFLDLGGSIPIFLVNEINSKAVVQFIWKIYDEILKRRKNEGGQS